MKKFNFNPNVLTAGVALALGFGIANGVSASTSSGSASPTGGIQINNTATASYSVDGVAQPTVTSNAVVVNVNEIGSFTLFATLGTSPTDDKNEGILALPNSSVTFTNTLKNTGNVTDTYTIDLKDVNSNIIGAKKDGTFGNLAGPITVIIRDTNGNEVGATTTINPGQTITLLAGYTAELSYALKVQTSSTTPLANDSILSTLSATSSYLTKVDSTKANLINENQAIVSTPIFSIVKSASSTIDLNTTTSFQYTIKVTNTDKLTYSADATNILIQDTIPAGLALDTTQAITVTGAANNGSTSGSTASKLVVSGVNLNRGQTATITFTVKVTDKAALAAAGSVVNNAEVYDNYDTSTPDTANPQIRDSTDSSVPNTSTKTTTTDDGTDPAQPGGDQNSTVVFTNRNVTISAGTPSSGVTAADGSFEIAPTSTQTIKHTITNTGNQAEGSTTNPLQIAITDATTGNNIQPTGPVTVTIFDKNGSQVATKTYTQLTNPINVSDVLATGIPTGGTATVSYTEASSNNTTSNGEVVTKTEKTAITLTPSGTGAPAAVTVTDTFSVKSMTLVKTQVIDADCDGNPDPNQTYSKADINDVRPGQCIIYRIEALNGFTTKDLTGVQITDTADKWSKAANYVAGTARDSANGLVTTPTQDASGTDTGSVVSSLMSIPKTTDTANPSSVFLRFIVKIKTSK